MGWFSKTVPQRKWIHASTALGHDLQSTAGSWWPTFQREVAAHGIALISENMGKVAAHYVSMLQLSAVAATLQENGYVADATFFLELLYIGLTQRPPAGLNQDIGALPFARAGDAQESLTLWARSMAAEVSTISDNPKLLEQLARYGALLVIQAKIATCEACGDRKGASKMREFLCE
jgi:hypothetical protein